MKRLLSWSGAAVSVGPRVGAVVMTVAFVLGLSGVGLSGVGLSGVGLAAEPESRADEASAPGPAPGPVVVEMFTSQGCGSCLPAEDVLADLAARPEVIALALHVDYWDYIGWPDPYGKRAHTARQKAYVQRFSGRYLITPQAVIDGREALAGTRPDGLETALGRALAAPNTAHPRFVGGDPVQVAIPAAPNTGKATPKATGKATPKAPLNATVWVLYYDRHRVDRVTRGENAGKTLTHHNVVRDRQRLGTWDGTSARFTLDAEAAHARGRTGCAVIVQAHDNGPILGAARMDLPADS